MTPAGRVKRIRVPVFFAAFLLAFSWNGVLYKEAGLHGHRMLDVTCGAMLTAGVILAGWLWGRRSPRRWFEGAKTRSLISLGLVVVFGGVVSFWALAEGMNRSGVARGGLFVCAVPVVTALVDGLFGARLAARDIVPGAVVVSGGVVLSSSGLNAGGLGGDLWLTASVCCFAVANVAARFAMLRLRPIAVTTVRALGGGVGLSLLGGSPIVSGVWGLGSGLLSAIFLSCFYVVLREVGPSRASLGNIVAGMLTTFWGVWWFGEGLTRGQWWGAGVILAGCGIWVGLRLLDA